MSVSLKMHQKVKKDGSLEEGTEVHVVEEKNGWSKHEFGWTMSEYLK